MSLHPMTNAFREAFRRHPAGMAVIVAPPVVAFSLSMKSGSSEPLLRAETIEIQLLRYELLEGEAHPEDTAPEDHSLVYLDRRWHRLHKELGGGMFELVDSSRFM